MEYINSINKKLSLPKKELYLLRLFLFGFSNIKIMEFFNSDYKYIMSLKESIKTSFATDNWFVIIDTSIKLNCFDVIDYSDLILKKEALIFVNQNMSPFLEIDYHKSNLNEQIKKEIKELYQKLKTSYRQKPLCFNSTNNKLTKEDIKIIKLKYEGFSFEGIAKSLDYSEEQLEVMVKTLFDKMNVYNWFAVFRLTNKFGILTDSNAKFELQGNQISKEVSKILKSDLDFMEKKEAIYQTIIRAFTRIDFDVALKSKALNIFQ